MKVQPCEFCGLDETQRDYCQFCYGDLDDGSRMLPSILLSNPLSRHGHFVTCSECATSRGPEQVRGFLEWTLVR